MMTYDLHRPGLEEFSTSRRSCCRVRRSARREDRGAPFIKARAIETRAAGRRKAGSAGGHSLREAEHAEQVGGAMMPLRGGEAGIDRRDLTSPARCGPSVVALEHRSRTRCAGAGRDRRGRSPRHRAGQQIASAVGLARQPRCHQVVLPEPEAPMIATNSPRWNLQRDAVQHLDPLSLSDCRPGDAVSSEQRLARADCRPIGRVTAVRCRNCVPSSDPSAGIAAIRRWRSAARHDHVARASPSALRRDPVGAPIQTRRRTAWRCLEHRTTYAREIRVDRAETMRRLPVAPAPGSPCRIDVAAAGLSVRADATLRPHGPILTPATRRRPGRSSGSSACVGLATFEQGRIEHQFVDDVRRRQDLQQLAPASAGSGRRAGE